MTNEEFQRIVLEKLDRQDERFDRIEKRLDGIETRLDSVGKKLDAVYEQTYILSEFRTETLEKMDSLEKSVNRVEITTADNWGDIARIKAAR